MFWGAVLGGWGWGWGEAFLWNLGCGTVVAPSSSWEGVSQGSCRRSQHPIAQPTRLTSCNRKRHRAKRF
jgi:hypothetical protein